MALLFENREGGSLSGELIASYAMDTSLRNRDNLNESWSPAFRFSPYVETSIEDGKLRFATASKGSFETYFPTFQFRLNVAYLTKGLPDDQRIEAGDQVVVSYYGNYSASQTDRGANYSIDFSVEDANVVSQIEAVVGDDGYAESRIDAERLRRDGPGCGVGHSGEGPFGGFRRERKREGGCRLRCRDVGRRERRDFVFFRRESGVREYIRGRIPLRNGFRRGRRGCACGLRRISRVRLERKGEGPCACRQIESRRSSPLSLSS